MLACLALPLGLLQAEDSFVLEDFLNHNWKNEYVEFAMTPGQEKAAQAGLALQGPGEKDVPYQIVAGNDGSRRIGFLANLDPLTKREYRFGAEKAQGTTDLKLEEKDGLVTLSNGAIGIRLRRSLQGDEGPIAGVCLTSGRWVGGSQLISGQKPISYEVNITVRGPVYAEVVCRADFGGGKTWMMTFRLQAHEPVVLVDETFSLGDQSRFVVSLGENLSPDHLLFRSGLNGTLISDKISATQATPYVFLWQPWLFWVGRERGKWFGLYNEQGPDLLMVGARDSDVWIKPGERKDVNITIAREKEDIIAPLPLNEGQRRWLIGAFNKDACLEILQQKNLNQAPLPQQYVIKNEFPLNRVKDYVLRWDASGEKHPRLFVDNEDIERFRKTFQADAAQLALLKKNPLTTYQLDTSLPYFFGTGDAELGAKLAETAQQWMQHEVDTLLEQGSIHSFGAMPHHLANTLLPTVNLTDAILSDDFLTKEQQERLRAQAAFLGYTLMRPDYWSPERMFAANANMTTSVAAFQVALGSLLVSHPMARTWTESGVSELKNELDNWSDVDGGWMEAPHYAMVSYDYLLGYFFMARRTGFADYLFDPKMKLVAEWFAKLATPPDARVNGLRHVLPIGNTYNIESSGEFGLLASFWKEKDPQFASQMQWLYKQEGSQKAPGGGGFFPTLAGYRPLLLDPNIPEQAPAYQSTLFQKTGVVLRSGHPSDRETLLYLIAGPFRDHYDRDSGSITLWGKGRLIADDFGYNSTFTKSAHHSMVETPLADGLMRLKNRYFSEYADYVHGKDREWGRQILFMKSPDPLGPNYFLICDTMDRAAPATWRLWLTCDQVTLQSQNATVKGKEDVDTDVCFTLPTQVELQTEAKAITAVSLAVDGNYRNSEVSQTSLIATAPGAQEFTALIYPRLKTEKPPLITAIAGGHGAKVQGEGWTDYLFLAATPFSFKDDAVAFQGTVGAIRFQKEHANLVLGAKGSISAKGKTLESNKPVTEMIQ